MNRIKKVNEMSDKREKIHIDKIELREILHSRGPVFGFICVEDEITGSDPEDGGADHDVVIKRLVDDKYFAFHYSDWDMMYNFRRDFPEDLTEVFPKQITITKYI